MYFAKQSTTTYDKVIANQFIEIIGHIFVKLFNYIHLYDSVMASIIFYHYHITAKLAVKQSIVNSWQDQFEI